MSPNSKSLESTSFKGGMGTGMVQHSAAGSLRVSLNSPFLLSPNPPQADASGGVGDQGGVVSGF